MLNMECDVVVARDCIFSILRSRFWYSMLVSCSSLSDSEVESSSTGSSRLRLLPSEDESTSGGRPLLDESSLSDDSC